ncbi:hypothetical protein DPMN_112389 [Dreissena polymorpha]|uniref:Uncharacterized protein n=1 Tax=Dreissena polymorpha TaxID=45954 RepID=A0A9D4KG06_DREPO|nr:hypothetical protein DPMN_112389 [Dreissena polymorpha]
MHVTVFSKCLRIVHFNIPLVVTLSAVLGAKLHSNNPDIDDLSDPNRPTKLAERFSELHDNEWTNAFEILRKIPGSNVEETVKRLLQSAW